MWIYSIKTGALRKGPLTFIGYSGHPPFVNDPNAVCCKAEGPLPRGRYTINAPHESALVGPYALTLTPAPENIMCGRGDFLMHGDKKAGPLGLASHGCIILARLHREAVWNSGDHELEVRID